VGKPYFFDGDHEEGQVAEILDQPVEISTIQKKYQFTKKLGHGGFCDVFQAVEIRSGRLVAVKMMQTKPEVNENESMRRALRFRREMKLYCELNHPNIVDAIESGETDTGLLYIVFKLVEGQTLRTLLKQDGVLSVGRAMNIAIQVLEGLAAAHAKGIIHRDLKPENVMIVRTDATEKVKLLDFGISTFAPTAQQEFTRLTMTREFLGTPSYASPEQLRGEPVTLKTDIYSWGLLFWECLMGKIPFESDSVASIIQHQLSPMQLPIPVSLTDHGLGVLLRWVLEKDISRRCGNSGHILDRLKKISVDSIPQKNGFLPDVGFIPQSTTLNAAAGEPASSMPERRQVTVLCFAVNIDAISEQTSIEALDEIYHDLLQLCSVKIKEFGGHVGSDLGDRSIAYFGFPVVSETDARRAARAALELSALLTRRSLVFASQRGFSLTYQIGIHTGIVTVRSSKNENEKITGVTPNLAAKLCGSAPLNTIIISDDCYNLLKGTVECELAKLDNPAKLLPVKNVYHVIGERSFEGLNGNSETKIIPMVGRNFERDMILRNWDEIQKDKKGKVFCIQGDAGIGKTRLAVECSIAVQHKAQGAWMECRCTPENKNSPLYPLLDFFKVQLGLDKGKNEKDGLVLTEKIKELGMVPDEAVALLGPWLGISPASEALSGYSPLKIKEMLLKTVASLMVRIARKSNAVIMIEDLHWIDPTSLEVLPIIISHVKKEGLLLLLSARPEFTPAWDINDVEMVQLATLEAAEMEKLILGILQGQEIFPGILRAMVNRADGVPLFGEELARMFLEKSKEMNARQTVDRETVMVEIPKSLRDLLAGRLDKLGPAKETAQLASAIGRTFNFNILRKVSLRDESSLLADLDQLVSAGLLHVRLQVGNPEYFFHHALVRDSAFDSLTSKTKTEMHQRIARTLENEFPDIARKQPEMLAWHWAGAGEFKKATDYGIIAAESALSRFLNEETLYHAESALEWVRKLPAINQTKRELTINGILTQALMFKYGWAHPEVKTSAERSYHLVKQMGDNEHTFPTLWALAAYHHVASNRKNLSELTDEMHAYALKSKDISLQVASDTYLGLRYQADGDFAKSSYHLENAIGNYDVHKHANHYLLFGFDTRVFACSTLSIVRWISGHGKSTLAAMENAMSWARQLNHIPTTAIALLYRARTFQLMGDINGVREAAGELVATSERFGLPAYSAYGTIILSWATGNIEQADASTGVLWNMGCKLSFPLYKSLAADNEMKKGLFTEAIARIDECMKLCEEIDEPNYLPILHLRKGLYLRVIDAQKQDAIINSFETAAYMARKNGMFRTEWEALFAMQNITESADRRQRLEQLKIERPELMETLS
jgi:TOMM system kinase/cyclase fusion protein